MGTYHSTEADHHIHKQEFTIEDDQFGEKKIVELKEGGSKIPVTEDNKEDYVRSVVSYRLDNSIKEQVKAFLDGFYESVFFTFPHVPASSHSS